MPAQTLIIAAALAQTVRIPRAAREAAIERFVLIAHLVAAIVTFAVMIDLTLGLETFEIEAPAPLLAASAVGLFLLLGIRKLAPGVRSLRTIAITAMLFALCVHAADAWLIPDFDNRRSDRAFAQAAVAEAETSALVLIGPGLREDVLFYLGRSVRRGDSIDDVAANYKGAAIVTADQYQPTRRADRGDEVAATSQRPEKDRLYLFRFPKTPPQPGERR